MTRRCTPEECEYCRPWGPSVPGKTRCAAELKTENERDRGWKFSTTLGGPCVLDIRRQKQDRLF